MIQKDIKDAIISALKEKNTQKADVLRLVSSAFTNELVSKGKKPQDQLTDEEALSVITRIVKQRKDSIEQYENAKRVDLAEEEKAQLSYLEEYMPKLMSKEEIRLFIDEKIKNGLDIRQRGIAMKEIMLELKGKADGSLVKDIIESL